MASDGANRVEGAPPKLGRPSSLPGPGSHLSDRLTVVLSTSPTITHPSTRLIEETAASFSLVPGLSSCRLLIVADGFKLRDRYSLKQGAVTPELSVAYASYLRRLAALTRTARSPLAGAELLVLERHHGCAHGLRRALSRVTTPFVLPVQHDRPFQREVDLCRVLAAMEELRDYVFYVGLPTPLSLCHEDRVCSRGFPQAFFRERAAEAAGLRFLPLAAFLDSTHVARVSWYAERVFGPARHARLPRGCFLEDTMGQEQLRELRDGGAETHAWYGTFLLHAGAEQLPLVTHLDGHDSRAGRSDWFKWRFASAHLSDEEWADIDASCAAGGSWCTADRWGAAERVPGFSDDGCSETWEGTLAAVGAAPGPARVSADAPEQQLQLAGSSPQRCGVASAAKDDGCGGGESRLPVDCFPPWPAGVWRGL